MHNEVQVKVITDGMFRTCTMHECENQVLFFAGTDLAHWYSLTVDNAF